MKVYLGPGYLPAEVEPIQLAALSDLNTCYACGHEITTSTRSELVYLAGKEFGNWVRGYVTGRFHDGLLAELNQPREDEEELWHMASQ